jgi:hypothetical protein
MCMGWFLRKSTEATQLGQEFGQLAVVYGELRQEAEVIVCDRRREEYAAAGGGDGVGSP